MKMVKSLNTWICKRAEFYADSVGVLSGGWVVYTLLKSDGAAVERERDRIRVIDRGVSICWDAWEIDG